MAKGKITKSRKTKTKSSIKIFKNNSSFKRAVTQMDIQSGDKVTVIFDDGSNYIIERT